MSASRRSFLASALAAGAATSLFTIAGTKASGRVIGANDTIRLGVAGINGRGGAHINSFGGMKDVQITYLIDPDTRLFDSRTKSVVAKGGNKPTCVQDIRQALEDKNLDAISIASPNHWHSLLSIWACQAGKDVYVEKPLSHNVHEGRILVETAKKNGCIVQHGTQNRSSGGWAKRAAEIAEGKYGKLAVSRGTCYKGRGSIGMKSDSEAPTGLDFNLWLGPAQQRPFNGNLVHYNWHWFWDFGNGDIGNQGVHQMDVARWMIPGATLPKSVICVGGRFGYKDQGETPNTQVAIFDYGDSLLVFEVRGLKTASATSPWGENVGGVGNTQAFEKGSTAAPKSPASMPGVKDPTAARGAGGIFGNFINAMRSRKTEDLDAHVLEGHYSSALCHLANISFRLGQPAAFDPQKQAFASDDQYANEAFARMTEHLKDNGVQLNDTQYILGKKLEIDAEKETITNDPAANELLTRQYRAPFVVPEKV